MAVNFNPLKQLRQIAIRGKENASEIAFSTIGGFTGIAIGLLGLAGGPKDVLSQGLWLILTGGAALVGAWIGFAAARSGKALK